MARPERKIIGSGIAAFDGDIDANFSILTESPLPIVTTPTTSTLASSFPAADYDDCFALVDADRRLYISDGAVWTLYDRKSALVADSSASDATQMATDFNLLLTALKNSGLMASS